LKKAFNLMEISGDCFNLEEIAAENCGYFLEESLDAGGESVDLNFPEEKLELRIVSYKNVEEDSILCSKLFVSWTDRGCDRGCEVERLFATDDRSSTRKKTIFSFLNPYRDSPTSGKLFLYRRQLYLWTPSEGDSHMTSVGPSFRRIRCDEERVSFEDEPLEFTSGKTKHILIPLLVDRTTEPESLICLEENEQSSSLAFVRIGALGGKQLPPEVVFRSSEYKIKYLELEYSQKDNFALDENGFFYFKLGSPEKALKILAPDFSEVYTYPLENYRLWNLFNGERKLFPPASGREDLNVYLEKKGEFFALERKKIDTC